MYRSGFILVGVLLLCSSLFAQAPTLKQDAPGDVIGKKGGETREITLPGEVTLKLIWCPPATFTMGEGESAVEVTLTQGFWAAATETTQGQWTSVMGAKSQPWPGKKLVKVGPNFPATFVSHGVNADGKIEADSATSFCEKLTEIERKASRRERGDHCRDSDDAGQPEIAWSFRRDVHSNRVGLTLGAVPVGTRPGCRATRDYGGPTNPGNPSCSFVTQTPQAASEPPLPFALTCHCLDC